MMKFLVVLAWVFTVITLVVGIIGLSGNEIVIPYLPVSAGIMVALIVLSLILLNRRKKQLIKH